MQRPASFVFWAFCLVRRPKEEEEEEEEGRKEERKKLTSSECTTCNLALSLCPML
jgi:hypothetical protein